MTSKFGVVVKADPRSDIPFICQINFILQIESGIVDVNTIRNLFCRSIIERIIVVFCNFISIPIHAASDCLFLSRICQLIGNADRLHSHRPGLSVSIPRFVVVILKIDFGTIDRELIG